jgi:hypothetical protein
VRPSADRVTRAGLSCVRSAMRTPVLS